MTDFARLRRAMVDGQLRTFDVTDRAVIAAFDTVPREAFVADRDTLLAYSEADLSQPSGDRKLMRPMFLARLIQALELREGERVLVVAGGAGYCAALLAALGTKVVLVEEDEALAAAATESLGRLGVAGVTVVPGNLATAGIPGAPYDAILVEGIVETGLEPVLDLLAPDGRLVGLFARPGEAVRAELVRRAGESYGRRRLFDASGPRLAAFARQPDFVL